MTADHGMKGVTGKATRKLITRKEGMVEGKKER